MRGKGVAAGLAAFGLLQRQRVGAPAALAVAPPVIDPRTAAGRDSGPAPEMRQTKACVTPVVVGDPTWRNPTRATPCSASNRPGGTRRALGDGGHHRHRRHPNPRFPRLFPGGDFVQGLPDGGLTDCRKPRHHCRLDHRRRANPTDRPTPRPAGQGAPPPQACQPIPRRQRFPPPPTITATATVTAPAPPPSRRLLLEPPPGTAARWTAPADLRRGAGRHRRRAAVGTGPPPAGPDGVVGVAPMSR